MSPSSRSSFQTPHPPLIMFPYFRLEAFVGPIPSFSPISTLYIDWSSLAFLVKALSLPHSSLSFFFIYIILSSPYTKYNMTIHALYLKSHFNNCQSLSRNSVSHKHSSLYLNAICLIFSFSISFFKSLSDKYSNHVSFILEKSL